MRFFIFFSNTFPKLYRFNFSKHRVAKNAAESAKNFKNISMTVSERQQMRIVLTPFSYFLIFLLNQNDDA